MFPKLLPYNLFKLVSGYKSMILFKRIFPYILFSKIHTHICDCLLCAHLGEYYIKTWSSRECIQDAGIRNNF